MKQFIARFIAQCVYKVLNSSAYQTYKQQKDLQKRAAFQSSFRSLISPFHIPEPFIIRNPQYISIGRNFLSLQNLRIEAWDEYEGVKFTPEIIIGDNVCMNTDVHIGCINKVIIGNNVLMASRIYISDHFHGEITMAALKLPPAKRPLFSKGPVIINDNVWIGEGVCILPGVEIGKNAIIGANSVVTRNIPPDSVAVGIPAKISRQLI